ncbi:MAG: hypothetical protein SFY32_15935 [Bacteroidota bacterium]|nr:hypothetical protein [Bacteroidota bacterium]
MIFTCTNDNKEDIKPKINDICNKITISFKNDIVPIFNTHCINPGCHSGNSPQSNLNLESDKAYVQLSRKSRGYIDTLEPKNTVLYASLTSTISPMPPSGKLDDCTLALFEKWMKQGAKNN